MSTVIPIEVGGVTMFVEATPMPGSEDVNIGDKASAAFSAVQDAIIGVAGDAISAVRRSAAEVASPSRVEVSFGMKFATTGSVLFSSMAAESTVQIKLTYDSKDL